MNFSAINHFEYVFGNPVISFEIPYRIARQLGSWQRYVQQQRHWNGYIKRKADTI